jgi:uracil-DNA glycosylase family protein
MEPRPPAPVPERPSLRTLRSAAHACRACDLYAAATQPVMGEGARSAAVMLVGEQPGDREDLEGHPFVGPAGRVLDRGLERAGIPPGEAYITNVVKHFRYRARGKRRIHQKPDRWQVNACLPWLHAELAVVRPDALVCLGATAAQALLGSQVRIGRDRGKAMDSELAELVTVTTHPSAILRAQDDAERKAAMAQFVADLENVARWLDGRRGGPRRAARPAGRRAP